MIFREVMLTHESETFLRFSFQTNEIFLGLAQWRDAVERSVTCAQLSMALYVLESCVAWDKSIMKAVSFVFDLLCMFLSFVFNSFKLIELLAKCTKANLED